MEALTTSTSVRTLASVFLATLTPSLSSAADALWTGAGGAGLWNAAGNWAPAPPTAADTAIFGSGFASGISIFRFAGDANPNAFRINATTDFQLMGETLGLGSGSLTREAGASGTHTLLLGVNLNPNSGPASAPAVWNVGGSGPLAVTQSVSTGGRVWQVNAGTFGQARAPLKLAASVDGRLEASGEVEFQGLPNVTSLYSTAGLNLPDGTTLAITGPLGATLVGGAVRGPGTLSLGGSSLSATGTEFSGSPTLHMSPAVNATSQITGNGIAGLGAWQIGGSGTVSLGANVSAGSVSLGTGGVDLNGHQLTVTGPGSFTLPSTARLQSSTAGGTLRVEQASLHNDGASITGTPNLTMAPPTGVTTQVTGQGFNVGTVRIEGTGSASFGTTMLANRLEVATGGRLLTSATPLTVSNGVTLATGSMLHRPDQNLDHPMFVLSGGVLDNQGATITGWPTIEVSNGTSNPARIAGSPLVGMGHLRKSGAGTLTLDQDVPALGCNLQAGTLDLNGHTLSSWGPMVRAGSTLTDSGSGGRLLITSQGFEKEAGATITGTPDVTFESHPAIDSRYFVGSFRTPAGAPELGHVSIPATETLTIHPTSDVAMEHLTLTGTVKLFPQSRLSVSNGITFGDTGSLAMFSSRTYFDYNIIYENLPEITVTGGRIEYGHGVKFPAPVETRVGNFNNDYIAQDLVKLHVANDAAHPVAIAGPVQLTSPALVKSGAGTLTLESDVRSVNLKWATNGGTIDLHGQRLTIENDIYPGADVITIPTGATLSDTVGTGQLVLKDVTLDRKGGTVANRPDVEFVGVGGLLHTGNGPDWSLGAIEVATNSQTLLDVGSASAESLHVESGGRLSIHYPASSGFGRYVGTLHVQNGVRFEAGSIGKELDLDVRSGRIEDAGVLFEDRQQIVLGINPELSTRLSVSPPVGEEVIISGAGHLNELGQLRHGGFGKLTLETDLNIGSIYHAGGGLFDLNGHMIQMDRPGSSDLLGQLTDTSPASTGGIIMTGGNMDVMHPSFTGTPDLTLRSGSTGDMLWNSPLLNIDTIMSGLGTFKCETTGAPAIIHRHVSAQKIHAAGSIALGGQLIALEAMELNAGATIARLATQNDAPASLQAQGARLISHGAMLAQDIPVNITSSPTDSSTIEGTDLLTVSAALTISGTGLTTVNMATRSDSLTLSGGTVRLNGRTMTSPNIGLYDGVRVESVGGPQGALISATGSPITLRSGWIGADMQPMMGLVKSGTDTFTMAGSISQFGGTFNVLSGAVLIEGTATTGNMPLVVKSGAIIGGHGSINGTTTIESGGKLSPNGPLTMARPTVMAGAVMDFDVGTANETLTLPAGITGPAGGGKVTVNIRRAAGYTNDGTTYTLIDATAANGLGLNGTDYILGTAPARGTLVVAFNKLIFIPATDADGDGIEDNWELAKFGTITTANRTTDADGDGFIDLHEYAAGTEPKDMNSLLKITALTHANDLTALTFTTQPGQRYRLENSRNMTLWEHIYDIDSAAMGTSTTTSPLAPLGDGMRTYYRALPIVPEL